MRLWWIYEIDKNLSISFETSLFIYKITPRHGSASNWAMRPSLKGGISAISGRIFQRRLGIFFPVHPRFITLELSGTYFTFFRLLSLLSCQEVAISVDGLFFLPIVSNAYRLFLRWWMVFDIWDIFKGNGWLKASSYMTSLLNGHFSMVTLRLKDSMKNKIDSRISVRSYQHKLYSQSCHDYYFIKFIWIFNFVTKLFNFFK